MHDSGLELTIAFDLVHVEVIALDGDPELLELMLLCLKEALVFNVIFFLSLDFTEARYWLNLRR